MDTVFLKLLNMSITASWLVLAVILLRLLLKKAPKSMVCLLWVLVAIRLVCPISLESVWSLIPSVETVPEDIGLMQEPAIHSGVPLINHTVNPMLQESFAPEPLNSVNPLQVVTWAASHIWVIGVVVMVLYVGISYWRVYRRVRASLPMEKGVRVCDEIGVPFILGVIRPTIYLPSSLAGKDVEYVLAHERAHLKRKDHFWKPLAFALLTVYWFQPLLWVAYLFFSRDIEMACDEWVIREMDSEEKKEYTRTLLSCSLEERQLPACPLAFGEVGVKGRVKSMKNYKKPSVILAIVAVLALVLGGIFFLTNPKEMEKDEKLETALAEAIQTVGGKWGVQEGQTVLEDHIVLGTREQTDGMMVYLMVYAETCLLREEWISDSSFHMPIAVELKDSEDGYSIKDIWIPEEGTRYVKSIRETFPWYLWGKVDTQDYIKKQQENCRKQLEVLNNTLKEHHHMAEIITGEEGKVTPIPFDYQVAYVGKEHASDIYEGALGVYRLIMSSMRYYPLHQMNSVDDMKAFREKHKDEMVFTEGYATYESYDQIVKKYDEAFFKENALLIVYVTGSVGDTYCADSVIHNEANGKEYLSVYLERGEQMTGLPMAPLSSWLVLVEVEKEATQVDQIYAVDLYQ